MAKSLSERDQSADNAITIMMSSVVGTAVIPAAVNWAVTASILAGGVVAIAKAYDISITKDDGWKVVKQIFLAAGAWWLTLNIGGKFIVAVLQATGLGYVAAVAMDAVISGASAWAIGSAAKAYFRSEFQGHKLSNRELGEIFKEEFKKYKDRHKK